MVFFVFFLNPSKLIKPVYEIIMNIICKNYYHLVNTVSIQQKTSSHAVNYISGIMLMFLKHMAFQISIKCVNFVASSLHVYFASSGIKELPTIYHERFE